MRRAIFRTGTLHQNLFDVRLIEEMLDRVGFGISDVMTTRADLFTLATKTREAASLPTRYPHDALGSS